MPQPDLTHAVDSAATVIRPAAIDDVPYIHHLLEIYAALGNLLPRTMSEIYRHLRDFFVIEVNGKLAGCGALEIFTEHLGEVRSLVVDDAFKGQGFGRLLVERIIKEARLIGLRQLMALTYAAPFFHKLGFKTVPKDTFPEKVWGICLKCYKYNNCDETAVLLELKG